MAPRPPSPHASGRRWPAAPGKPVSVVSLAQAGQGGERGELGQAAAPDDHPAVRRLTVQPHRRQPAGSLVVPDPAAAGEVQPPVLDGRVVGEQQGQGGAVKLEQEIDLVASGGAQVEDHGALARAHVEGPVFGPVAEVLEHDVVGVDAGG